VCKQYLRRVPKQRKIHARSRDHCCSGIAIIITHSECVFVALVIQHAKHMRRILLQCVSCQALPYFSTLSHKCHDFVESGGGGGVGFGGEFLNLKCVF
jgi:hypothetical protein